VTTLLWLLAAAIVVLGAIAAVLLWSIFRPVRFLVDRPDHKPEWIDTGELDRMTDQRLAAAEHLGRHS